MKFKIGSFKDLLIYIVVFICGMSTMGVELTASRLLAPFIGSSIYVWTNIIGVFLISLSIGYFLGGRYSDKHPNEKNFYYFSLIAGVLIGIIPIISSVILERASFSLTSISSSDFYISFFYSIALFSIPAIFLGAIVPYAVRINSKKINSVGNTSGKIYAISSIGSIIGVYLPALLLVPTIGTRMAITLFSMILILVSIVAILFTQKKNLIKKSLILLVLIFLIFASFSSSSQSITTYPAIIYEKEGPYSLLQVEQLDENKIALVSNSFYGWSIEPEGQVFLDNYYNAHVIQTSFTENIDSILILGLGAGVTARSFSMIYPNATIDGVEIDPLVLELGKEYFDLSSTDLNIFTMDGRLFVRTTEKKYDAIVLDMYLNGYMPHHLITKEFFDELNSIMTDDATISINLVTYVGEDRINEIIGNTILQVFPKVYTAKGMLFVTKTEKPINEIKSLIIDKRDNLLFPNYISDQDKITLKKIFTDYHDELVEMKETNDFYFTDDFAPIEHIIYFN